MAKAIAALLLTAAQALQAPHARPAPTRQQAAAVAVPDTKIPDAISAEHPLRVVIAGAGVGGLTLANALKGCDHVDVQLIEKTSAFKRFGGPIQLASNAMQLYKELDANLYDQIESKFTWTGNLTNGIKDGIRDEWYAKFDLASPARDRGMPYTGVIERPDLQEILLGNLEEGVVNNGVGVHSYTTGAVGSRITGPVDVKLEDDQVVAGDVLVGADGIWSQVRAAMRDEPARGDGSGVAYSGYTVFAGELAYNSPDNGEVGYKVYIGPNQYFVITVRLRRPFRERRRRDGRVDGVGGDASRGTAAVAYRECPPRRHTIAATPPPEAQESRSRRVERAEKPTMHTHRTSARAATSTTRSSRGTPGARRRKKNRTGRCPS